MNKAPWYSLIKSFILDSSAIVHVYNNKSRFITLDLYKGNNDLIARDSRVLILVIGTITIIIKCLR
jgi:hypothetical protein